MKLKIPEFLIKATTLNFCKKPKEHPIISFSTGCMAMSMLACHIYTLALELVSTLSSSALVHSRIKYSSCCGAIQAQRNGTQMLASSGYVAVVDVFILRFLNIHDLLYPI